MKTTILIAVLMLLIAPAHADPLEKFADIKILFIHPCSLPVKEAGQNISWQNTTLQMDIEEPDTLIAGNRNLDYDIIFVHMLNYQPELYSMIDKARNENVSVIFTSSTSEWAPLINVNKSILDNSVIYIDNGGEENMRSLLTYLAVMLKGVNETVKPPILIPDNAIFHPDYPDYMSEHHPCPECVFQNVTSYFSWYSKEKYKSNAPTVGIAFYKSYYANNDFNDTTALIREFERRGANVIPVFYKDNFSEFFQHESLKPDVIVYQRAFRVDLSDPDAGIKALKEMNVPWMQAITLYQTEDEWMNSSQGISPVQIPGSIAMPELDGIVEPFVIGAQENSTKKRIGIPERIERFANRTLMLANLHNLNNNEKRVALIYYNYPPGKDSIGAAYLDVPMTLEVLLNSFYDRGYDLGNFTKFNLSEKKNISSNESIVKKLLAQGRNIGVWKQDEIDALARSGAVALVHNDTYVAWFNELPEELRNEVIKEWGKPPGNQMIFENASGKYVVIPNIRYGNMLLAPQPYRGFLNDVSKTYHDAKLPPNHQYIAFYFWLKKVYNASALVHVGTHGTLEWLPGKQLGLSVKCWSDILIQDFPNSYIYIMDNVGEGTQAKRRSYSVIIDHLTPAFMPSGLYGNLSALHEVLQNYEQAKPNNQSLLMEAYKNESLSLMLDLNLSKDLNISISTNMNTDEFESIIEKTHDYLHELQFMNMPYGLRIFGMNPNNESMITLVSAMLGDGFLKNIENMNSNCPADDHREHNQTCSFRLLYEVLINNKDARDAQYGIIGKSFTNITSDLIRAKDYANRIQQSSIDEINNLLDSLEGKYILPAAGGDPIRNPSALPTGRNFYSFDPRTIPTKASYQVGKQTMDALLNDYYNRTGRYPEKVAFTVWATETMRHQGVVHSQILYLLGLEPKYDKMGRVIYYMSRNPDDLRLMNESELERPRIDVMIISSGLHRDQFPLQMELMDAAVRKAISAENKTYDNYPKKHYHEIKTLLINATCGKFSKEEVDKLAAARIFSEAPGSYGPKIGNPIESSHTWNDTKPIAELYLKALGNIYINGSFDNANSCIFASYLNDTEIAIHSRSSNLIGVLDNDDVFQYLGGLSLAIAHVSEGKRPEMWITNLRNPQEEKMQTLSEFMLAEERTRLFNPLWIKGLMEHGYSGPRTLANHMENLWGWQVVDPRFVDAYTWQQVYDIYVQDKYSLGLKDYYAENNPWAYQSITARMLEAIRKGYWDPDENVKKSLAKEFEDSVKKYNVACCHHTCSNLLLRDYIDGIISMPVSRSNEEKTISKGAGFESEVSGEKEYREAVSGHVFQKKEQAASSLSPGSAPLIGILFVIMILSFIAFGYLRRR
ncbi:MAG: cobaltochelatase subunit CobN [Methanobacteriota archaeon]